MDDETDTPYTESVCSYRHLPMRRNAREMLIIRHERDSSTNVEEINTEP